MTILKSMLKSGSQVLSSSSLLPCWAMGTLHVSYVVHKPSISCFKMAQGRCLQPAFVADRCGMPSRIIPGSCALGPVKFGAHASRRWKLVVILAVALTANAQVRHRRSISSCNRPTHQGFLCSVCRVRQVQEVQVLRVARAQASPHPRPRATLSRRPRRPRVHFHQRER